MRTEPWRRPIYLLSAALCWGVAMTVAAIPYDARHYHAPVAPAFFALAVIPTGTGLLGGVLSFRYRRVGWWVYALATAYYVLVWIAFLYVSILALPSLVLQFAAARHLWRRRPEPPGMHPGRH
jgi:hypothetical protein